MMYRAWLSTLRNMWMMVSMQLTKTGCVIGTSVREDGENCARREHFLSIYNNTLGNTNSRYCKEYNQRKALVYSHSKNVAT